MCGSWQFLAKSKTSGVLSSMFFFHLTSIPILVLIRKDTLAQKGSGNNWANHPQFVFTRIIVKASSVDVVGRVYLVIVDRRAQSTMQAGSYWKINHKSSHLGDREWPSQNASPVWLA